jgi:hypothetical protein
LGKKFALLLDVDKVLSADEMLDLREVSGIADKMSAHAATPIQA